MSMTIEFFSGHPNEFLEGLKAWLNAESVEEENAQSERLYAFYPHADFSFHLHWPEDIDTLCQVLVAQGLDVPQSSVSLLVEELWSDQESLWIDRISQQFVDAVAGIRDNTAKLIIEQWIPYSAEESASNTALYTQRYDNGLSAFFSLRAVAQDVITYRKELLLLRVW